jgi:hypothetical protein
MMMPQEQEQGLMEPEDMDVPVSSLPAEEMGEGEETMPTGDVFERLSNLTEEESAQLQQVLEANPLVKEIMIGLVEKSAELMKELDPEAEGGDPLAGAGVTTPMTPAPMAEGATPPAEGLMA